MIRKVYTVITNDKHSSDLIVNIPKQGMDDSKVLAVILPAMGVKATYYLQFAEAMAQKGIPTILTDLRGIGSSSVNPKMEKYDYINILEQDIPTILNKVKELFPSKPILLVGHSLGGQLSVLYSSIDKIGVVGLVLIASGSVYFRSYGFPARYFVFFGTQIAYLISVVKGSFPGEKLGFGGNQSKGIIADWARQSRTGKYLLNSSKYDFESLISVVKIPCFAISVDNDWYAPVTSVDHLCGKLKSTKVERWHFSVDNLEEQKIDHFRWTKNSRGIADRIHSWIVKII